jgi:Zn-dependent peptidase ImmA (M78 family)
VKLEPYFKRRCEAIAVEQRYQLKLRPYDPLPAEMLLEKLKGEAKSPDKIPNMPIASVELLLNREDWSAGIIRLCPLLIVYNPAHSPARHQSNLMHEFAHVLLDHPMIGFDPITGLPLRNARCEDEAVYLGGCLQIPRLGLKWIVEQQYTLAQTVEYFGASENMVRFRCNMTGIKMRDLDL